MIKNNIAEKGKEEAAYRSLINPEVMDDLKERILKIILFQKRYKDKDFSAKKLAEELGTNMRYVSAVVNVKFHMNYTSFVNKFRIDEAMILLADERYRKMSMEDVSDMIGFSNRQSFYASFFKVNGITPREYKISHLGPAKPTPVKKVRKSGSKNKKKTVKKE